MFLIPCDNGPEYVSSKLKDWAKKHEIEMRYIQPGNPQKMNTWSASIGQSTMTCLTMIFLMILRRCKKDQQNGSGAIIMRGLTWLSVVLPLCKN